MVTEVFRGWAADRLLGELWRGEVPRELTPGDVACRPLSTVSEQRGAFGDAGGPDWLVARIDGEEPGFRAKRWTYRYSALALPTDRARALLSHHGGSDDAVVAQAARVALSHLA